MEWNSYLEMRPRHAKERNETDGRTKKTTMGTGDSGGKGRKRGGGNRAGSSSRMRFPIQKEGKIKRGGEPAREKCEWKRIASHGVNERSELKAARSFQASCGLQEPQPLRKSM